MEENSAAGSKKEVNLRPYQQECIDTIEKAGNGHHLIAIATGLGKTVIFSHIKRKGRVLIVSHRDELVRQPEKYYDCSFGVEKAEEYSDGEEVISASVQTLNSGKRLSKFRPDEFHTIIIDESHHASAPSYKRILNYFSGVPQVLGFTATPKRGDNVRLDDVFDDIIYQKDLRWGIENGYLSRLRSIRVSADYDLSKVAKVAGDYNQEALERVIVDGEAIPAAARIYVDECHKKERHTLIYCVSRYVCTLLQNTIRELLQQEERNLVQVVTGLTPADERSMLLKQFETGQIKCLINCMVLTEGTDLPIADCIINMRPTCNPSLYQQIVGRGMRLCDGKDYCLVIDVLPDDEENRDLCSAPTLFGVDPTILDKESKKKVRNGGFDLLDICAGISDSMAEVAQDIDLRIQNVNLFLDQCDELMEQSKDIMDLSGNYTSYRNRLSASDDLNFLGMDVEIQPDESRYYKIKPNWYDKIYLSKPDILGDTTIEADIKEGSVFGFPGEHIFIGTLPIEKAILFSKKICEIQDDYYMYSWDRETQKFWEKKRLTSSQEYRLIRDYGKQISMSGVESINKLSASRLIDLNTEKQEKEDLKELLEKAAKPRKSKSRDEAKKELQMRDAEKAKERVQGKADFQQFYKNVMDADKNIQEEQKKDGNLLSVSLTYEYYPRAGKPCSDNQRAYILQMRQSLEKRNVCFQGMMENNLTARQASVLITILSSVQSRYHGSGNKKIMFDDMSEFLRRIELGEKPQKVQMHYEII